MGELYNPYPKLPKNIRQVGDRDQVIKLYVEDYVNTYLKRLYPKGGQDLKVGVLLGEIRLQEGLPIVFVEGAIEMEDVTADGQKVEFTEEAWKCTYQTMEQMFPKRSILGWFLCGTADSNLSPLKFWKQHSQYFSGKNQLMYLNSGLDGEESVYITSEEGFYQLRGYHIYYEKNQMMQDYMITRKDKIRVEVGLSDDITKDFRQRLEENKVVAVKKRSAVHILSVACSVLTVMVFASGVMMMNNYQKMKDMERVIVSAIPENIKKEWSTIEEIEDEVIVEQVAGEVYPTQTSVYIETMEQPRETTMEETQPETVEVVVPADAILHTVQKGETLHTICLEVYGGLDQAELICQWNHIADENKIAAGQVLYIPAN